MAEIIAERMTAAPDGEVVVFLIGMRINRFWKLRKWLPVAFAMPRMLRELERSPDVGFLGFHTWIGNPTITLQYWRSFERLEQYAKDAARLHRTAWAPFNHAVGKSGDVGVWHATYRVGPVMSNASTTTCRSSVWRGPRGPCGRKGVANLRAAACRCVPRSQR